MLVIEVIKLNRILDLLMTLDVTYILSRPTDFWIGRNILNVECQSESDNLKYWTA